ncbi:integrase family protein [Noviherbaspirillum pedocola]|uniref:Integrase family protein n=1 Tax=Noviherbaspirillum pedocola TaxID=2801341 RepID=A0A934SQK8_9BURK|nr:integrase family protein [Noviherbaspirillum pedocola]MBK4733687.1 integrase family protein [Noviherbaspirillum pedocola]
MPEKHEQEDANKRFDFTKKLLLDLPFTNGKQVVYYDTKTKGLGIRVGKRTKTFFVYRRVKGGRPVRITIGEFPLISLEDAKIAANKNSADLSQGIDRIKLEKEAAAVKAKAKAEEDARLEARRKAKAEGKSIAFEDVYTVQDVFTYYIQEQLIKNKGNERITQIDDDGNEIIIKQSSTLKDADLMVKYFDERTIITLKKIGNEWVKDATVNLPSWLDIPFRDITATMVVERFEYFSRACPTRTNKEKQLAPIKRTHQLVFKYALSAFSYSINRLKFDLTDSGKPEALTNPFEVLSVTKKWKKTEIREKFIDFDRPECARWWSAVLNYKKADGVVSDYLFFSLIQAGRSIDIASLTWNKVNFKEKTITYSDTKNSRNYIFPLTRFSLEILERRWEYNKGKEFIFEYPNSKNGYVPQDCKDHFKAIAEVSGVLISHHDLRRTWATEARRMKTPDGRNMFDERNIAYCLKHHRSDVGEHYFQDKKGEITFTLQKVEDALLSKVAEFSALEQLVGPEKQEKDMELA